MKYIRWFSNVKERDNALKNIKYNILQYTVGIGVSLILKNIKPIPSYSTPFYVENITNNNEILTIVDYKYNESDFYKITIEYSTDKISWNVLGTTGSTPLTKTLHPNDKIYLRAQTSGWYETGHCCKILGVSKIGGNIMSLLYGSNFTGNERSFPTASPDIFYSLFFDNTNQENSNLLSASELLLPATILSERCYSCMFRNCTSLTSAPELPATTLVSSCYEHMFSGCTSLTTAPELPATTLANSCYEYMFQDCTSLTTAPELPAITLANSCYHNMFAGCTSLTTAPELPATILVYQCYCSMFYGCNNLNYIKCLATNISAANCTERWVTSVSPNGTFIKNQTMEHWTVGNDGIPYNWTVENEII